MIKITPLCIINGATQNCKYCHAPNVIKNGFTANGSKRYRCKECQKRFIGNYKNRACYSGTKESIIALIKEGCSIRSISRLLRICCNTVQKMILSVSKKTPKSFVSFNKSYELDELCTYIGNKSNRIWIAYAYCRESGSVVDFVIGTRSKMSLQPLIDVLLHSAPKTIYTDKHQTYTTLIPATIHSTMRRGTNHIERKNLTLRTHLKRLNRRTICFSKSVVAMLQGCLMIYFFG
ncbi:IS1 transposase [compost metagenome]